MSDGLHYMTSAIDGSRAELRYRILFERYSNPKQLDACGICHKFLKDNKLHTRPRYGILQSCKHVYCLPCIQGYVQEKLEYRRRKLPRKSLSGHYLVCPTCRVASYFIGASESVITSLEDRARFFGEYMEAVRFIKCEFFRCGYGKCFCLDNVNHDV